MLTSAEDLDLGLHPMVDGVILAQSKYFLIRLATNGGMSFGRR